MGTATIRRNEQAKWETSHHERQQAARRAREEHTLTPGQIALKLMKAVLDFHTKLDPVIAPYLPGEAWDELNYRFDRLRARMAEFQAARDTPSNWNMEEPDGDRGDTA